MLKHGKDTIQREQKEAVRQQWEDVIQREQKETVQQ